MRLPSARSTDRVFLWKKTTCYYAAALVPRPCNGAPEMVFSAYCEILRASLCMLGRVLGIST